MQLDPLPLRAPLAAYEGQAAALSMADRSAPLSIGEARQAVARHHDFADWDALAAFVSSLAEEGPVLAFETAVEAAVSGDLAALVEALRRDPGLVHARSSRVVPDDPPAPHRATLLHYVAANGVERSRQRTPANAVVIAHALLERAAEPDALADMYGGACTTLSLLVSSLPPAKAGLQVPLVDLLLDFGAAPAGHPSDAGGPLFTALAHGMADAARVLARRSAPIALPEAAGLGLTDLVAAFLPSAEPLERHRALALAAQHGQVEALRLLLDAGENPNRFNPQGNHAHSTPLHQAVLAGHEAVVLLLVECGARLDVRDKLWQGTPLGWALHGGGARQGEMAACLRALGATA